MVNGSNNVIIYAVNSFILQQNLPNAQLILYPDGNHVEALTKQRQHGMTYTFLFASITDAFCQPVSP